MIALDAARCVRSASPLASCSACQASCPRGAIRIDGGVPKIEARCDDCDVCVQACPTGALRARAPRPLADHAERARGGAVVSCAATTDARRPVPCHASLAVSEVVELALRSEGLVLRRGDCAACSGAHLQGRVRALEEATHAVLRALGKDEDLVRFDHAASRVERRASPGEGVSRRGLLSLFGRAAPPAEGDDDPLPPRRRAVLALLGRQRRPLSADAGLAFRFEPPPACDGCAVCVKLCPTEALGVADDGDLRVLEEQLERCVGCGLCVDVCRPPGAKLHACNAEPGALDADAVPLLQLRKVACGGCRMPVYARHGGDAPSSPSCFVCEAARRRA